MRREKAPGIHQARNEATYYGKRYSGMTATGQIQLVRLAEELSVLGVDRINLGPGAADYKERLKSYDTMVGAGVVTTGSVLGTAHRVRASATRRLVRAMVGHPQLSRATRRLRDFVR